MASDKPSRLPLRQLVTAVEKSARELSEHYQTTLSERLYELRELSRPVRRHSRYPTKQAVQNGLQHLHEAWEQVRALGDQLDKRLEEIRVRARPGQQP